MHACKLEEKHVYRVKTGMSVIQADCGTISNANESGVQSR